MKKIRVDASVKYDVLIGKGLLEKSGDFISGITEPCSAVIITDDIVSPLYADKVKKSLEKSGFECDFFVIPNGESSKSLENFEKALELLAEKKLTSSDIIVALGGGVPGDLAGFAAASYLRGIRFVQIPTTFLAAVDSSVGGKTAVNLKAGKNLAGAFHQPSLVICDTDAFLSLPKDVFADGVAETVKYGVLTDSALFDKMGTDFSEDIEEIVARCVQIKAEIVEADEFDKGKRMLLNLGHTIGHAVEKCSEFKITHGHAVAIGMAAAAFAAEKEGISEKGTAEKISDTLLKCGLPIASPFKAEELAAAALSDKKRRGDTITFVMPQKIGKCLLKKVSVCDIEKIISEGIDGAGMYKAQKSFGQR